MRLQQHSLTTDDNTDYPIYAQIHKPRYVQYNHTRRKLSFVNKTTSPVMRKMASDHNAPDDPAITTGSRVIRSDDDLLAVSLESGQVNVEKKPTMGDIHSSPSGTREPPHNNETTMNAINVSEDHGRHNNTEQGSSHFKCLGLCIKCHVLSCFRCLHTRCRALKYSEKSKRRFLSGVSCVLFVVLFWCLGLALLGTHVKPGGCVFGLIVLYISTFIIHRLLSLTPLPSYVGKDRDQ